MSKIKKVLEKIKVLVNKGVVLVKQLEFAFNWACGEIGVAKDNIVVLFCFPIFEFDSFREKGSSFFILLGTIRLDLLKWEYGNGNLEKLYVFSLLGFGIRVRIIKN